METSSFDPTSRPNTTSRALRGAGRFLRSAAALATGALLAATAAPVGHATEILDHIDGGYDLDLNDVLFENQTAVNGGAINQGSGVIRNATFRNNVATWGYGGAICNDGGNFLIADSLFEGNRGGNRGNGSAYYGAYVGSATFENVRFVANTGNPACWIAYGHSLNVTGGEFLDNPNGALYVRNDARNVLLDGVVFRGNGGTVISVEKQVNYSPERVFRNVTLVENNTSAVISGWPKLEATDGKTLLISGNTFDAGGGVRQQAASLSAVAGVNDYAPYSDSTLGFTINAEENSVVDMRDPFAVEQQERVVNYQSNGQSRGSVAYSAYPVNIVKEGPGTWKLAGENKLTRTTDSWDREIASDEALPTSPASGDTTFAVNAGTLHLYCEGEVPNANIADPNAAVAAGKINLAGDVTFSVASGATLSIGGGNEITAQTITFEQGANLYFDLSPEALAVVPAQDARLKLAGDTLVLSAQNIRLDENQIGNLNNIALIDASGVTNLDFTASTYYFAERGADGTTWSKSFTVENKKIHFDVSAPFAAGSAAVTWTGATSGDWTNSGPNFSGSTAAGIVANNFLNGDDVRFDDTAAANKRTVNISGGTYVSPRNVVVETSGEYVFQNGGIAATGTLTKQGTGTAVFRDTTARFDGSANVASGTLALETAELSASTVTIASGATLSISGGDAITAQTITFEQGANLYFDLSPEALAFVPTQNTRLSFTGDTLVLSAQNIRLDANQIANFDSVALIDATGVANLDFTAEAAYSTERGADGMARTKGLFIENKIISFAFSAPFAAGSAAVTWTGATNSDWANSRPNFSGTTAAGIVANNFLNGDDVRFDDTAAASKRTVNIPGGAYVSPRNVVVETSGEYVFQNGGIAATGALTKQGTGTAVFRNTAARFDGGVNVASGTLALEAAELRAPELSVAAGATLRLGTAAAAGRFVVDSFSNAGVVSGAGRLRADVFTNTAGGILSPGGDGAVGILEIEANSFTNNGVVRIDFTENGHDKIINLAETPLDIGGKILVHIGTGVFDSAQVGEDFALPGWLETAAGAGAVNATGEIAFSAEEALPWFLDTASFEFNAETGAITFQSNFADDARISALAPRISAGLVRDLCVVMPQAREMVAAALAGGDGGRLRDALHAPLGFASLTAMSVGSAQMLDDEFASALSGLFLLGGGHWERTGNKTSAPYFDGNRGSVGVGYKYENGTWKWSEGKTFALGAGLSCFWGTAKFHDNVSDAREDGVLANFYGDVALGPVLLSATGFGGWREGKSRRYFADTLFNGENEGTVWGGSVRMEAPFRIRETFSASPFVGFTYTGARSDGFTEDGDAGALQVGAITQNSLLARVGIKSQLELGRANYFELAASYGRELGDREVDLNLGLAGGGSYMLSAPATARDHFTIEPSWVVLGLFESERGAFRLSVPVDIADTGTAFGFNATFSYWF